VAEQIENEFGTRVLKLVEGESENKRPGIPATETWLERKQETLDHLQKYATTDEQIITIADKLSNIRSCWRDYQRDGDAIWAKFNMSDKEMQGWYYMSIRDALKQLENTEAWQEFNELVNSLFTKSDS
jgi:myo-inositol-1(or 4)-monophosphatase